VPPVRTWSIPILWVMLSAVAGCATALASTGTAPPARSQVRGCSSLTVSEVSRVARIPVRKQALTPPERQVRCSTAFFGGFGDVVLVIAERLGGEKTLNRLRAVQAGQSGASMVRPVVGLGRGAFVFRQRLLAFRRGARVVTLETGYSTTGGEPVLSVVQLERLARIVLQRLQRAP
jgi:hypothetical protein